MIVTWRRPENLRTALEHLASLTLAPSEVVVVDSAGDAEAGVVEAFPFATHLPFPAGARNLPRARNEGLLHVSGDVIAFLDDDAYPRPEWSAALVDAFRDPSVAAVAGRTCNGVPGEEAQGLDEIGRIRDDGTITANFAADATGLVDVDHAIGANMAFRRGVLAELGGFREDFGGTASPGEETDLFVRLRLLGGRVVFVPGAVVDHVGAPHVLGRRFDWRYVFWSRHNRLLMLARNYGLRSHRLRAWLVVSMREAPRISGPGGPLRRCLRTCMVSGALLTGLASAVVKARWGGRDPRLSDARASTVSRALERSGRR